MALSGIYGCLAKDDLYGQSLSVIFDAGADESMYNRRQNDNWTVSLYRYNQADSYLEKTWSGLYATINLSNLFLEKLKVDNFSEAQSNAYMAEVRFLRALCYMNLTFLWDEVPIRVHSTIDQQDNHLAPSSLKEVYQFIAEDLKYAAQYLPHANSTDYVPGRANSMAARALLARLYLKQAGYPLLDHSAYELADNQLDTIINVDKWHELLTVNGEITATNNGYRSLFLKYIQNEYYPKESMFEISFSYLRSQGIQVDGRLGAINGVQFDLLDGPYSRAMVNATPLLTSSYDENDIRAAWNLPAVSYSTAHVVKTKKVLDVSYAPGKYRRWEPTPTADNPNAITILEKSSGYSQNFTCVNFPVVRYADVLLMYAETQNELSEGPTAAAINAINKVRNRAGLANLTSDVTSSKEAFFNEIVEERFRELCFEGLRTFDLKRWGLLEKRLALLKNSIISDGSYTQTSDQHNSYLRQVNNFNPSRNLTYPYPMKEVSQNDLLEQKPEWVSAN